MTHEECARFVDLTLKHWAAIDHLGHPRLHVARKPEETIDAYAVRLVKAAHVERQAGWRQVTLR